MEKYNGYRSWNEWNVSLWINNDYQLYSYCQELVKNHSLGKASQIFMSDFKRTPDGAVYNRLSVYNTLRDLKNG
jgi:hypothetical protein